MGTRGNPTRRRQHPGSRIHLRKGHGRPACFPIHKTAAKRNLGTVVRRATLAANENRREISRVSRLPACCGAFFLLAFQFSAFQLYPNPPFPPHPPFPRLRSGHRLFQRPSPQKQIPSNRTEEPRPHLGNPSSCRPPQRPPRLSR